MLAPRLSYSQSSEVGTGSTGGAIEQGTGLRADSVPSFAPPQEYPRCYASEE